MVQRASSPPVGAADRQALDEAVLALRRQRPAEAGALAAAFLASHPQDPRAARILGQALLMQNRPREAIAALRRPSETAEDPALDILLARALDAVGETEAALGRLRRAIAHRPPLVEAFLELGGRLGKIGRADEGAAVLEEGLALCPDAAPLRIGLGYVHLQGGDRAKARAMFSEAHAAEPARHDALVALATVMALDGEHGAAADLYRRALQARPDDPMTRLNLAKCLLELGERDAGEGALRDVVRGAPHLLRSAIAALADPPRGRLFLRPSAAAAFLGVERGPGAAPVRA